MLPESLGYKLVDQSLGSSSFGAIMKYVDSQVSHYKEKHKRTTPLKPLGGIEEEMTPVEDFDKEETVRTTSVDAGAELINKTNLASEVIGTLKHT